MKAVLVFLAFVAAIFVAVSLIVEWSWNTVVPYILGLPTLDLGQAFALVLLVGVLFGSGNAIKTSNSNK